MLSPAAQCMLRTVIRKHAGLETHHLKTEKRNTKRRQLYSACAAGSLWHCALLAGVMVKLPKAATAPATLVPPERSKRPRGAAAGPGSGAPKGDAVSSRSLAQRACAEAVNHTAELDAEVGSFFASSFHCPSVAQYQGAERPPLRASAQSAFPIACSLLRPRRPDCQL